MRYQVNLASKPFQNRSLFWLGILAGFGIVAFLALQITGSSTVLASEAESLKDKTFQQNKDIDVLKLGRCIDTKSTAAEVEKEIAEGRALDVNGTPTIFVNGRRISQTIDWPNLKNIIDSEIEYQKTAKNAGDDCGCEVKLDVPGLPAKSPVIAPSKKK